MVDHDHPERSNSRQCALLGLPRSTLYYQPVSVRESTQQIMARFDALYMEDPCRFRTAKYSADYQNQPFTSVETPCQWVAAFVD